MKKLIIALVLLLPLNLIACANTNKPADTNVGKSVNEIVEDIVELIVKGINENNYSLIQSSTRQLVSEERAKTALKYYKHYFENELVNYEFITEETVEYSSFSPHHLYRLYSGDKELNIRLYDVGSDEIEIDYLEFISYYAYGLEITISSFVDGLKSKDAIKVAKSLQEDDLYYPINAAEKVLNNFSNLFDLETLSLELKEINPNTEAAVYTLHGTKDLSRVQYDLAFIFGDGLFAIRNGLIPHTQEVGVTEPQY